MHEQSPQQAPSHQARFRLLRNPEQAGFQMLPLESLVGPDMEVDLAGDPRHPDADEVVDANAATLREIWRSLVQLRPDKYEMQHTHSVVVDIGISKLRGGLGPSHPCATLILQRP